MPTEYFQSVNPILILALTPIIAHGLGKLARRHAEPGPVHKVGAVAHTYTRTIYILASIKFCAWTCADVFRLVAPVVGVRDPGGLCDSV